jgi:hypothetical protein
MTKQCRKLLSTQAALKNGLDAISRKKLQSRMIISGCMHLNKLGLSLCACQSVEKIAEHYIHA